MIRPYLLKMLHRRLVTFLAVRVQILTRGNHVVVVNARCILWSSSLVCYLSWLVPITVRSLVVRRQGWRMTAPHDQ